MGMNMRVNGQHFTSKIKDIVKKVSTGVAVMAGDVPATIATGRPTSRIAKIVGENTGAVIPVKKKKK